MDESDDESNSSEIEDDDDEEEEATEETTENETEHSTTTTTTEESSDEHHHHTPIKKAKLSKTTKTKQPCSRANTFFKRSDSTLCLGGEAPDPFEHTLDEALPLAIKPHLLNPHVRIQDMFRVRTNQVRQFKSLKRVGLVFANVRSNAPNLDMDLDESDLKSSKLKKSQQLMSKFEKQIRKLANTDLTQKSSSILDKPDQLIDRWRLTVDLFGRVFCDDVGMEPASIIRQLGGFQLKEAKFRREMERLRNSATRDLSMDVDRNRDLLLQMTFKSLNNMYNLQLNRRVAAAAANSSSSATSSATAMLPPLCLSRIKVTFRDEQGEGSGVARSFYTAFAEAILADANLPPLDNASLSATTSHIGHHHHHSHNHSSSSPSSIYSSFTMQRYRNVRSSISSEHSRRSAASAINNALNTTNAIRSSIRARDPQQLMSINSYLTSSHNLHGVSKVLRSFEFNIKKKI